MDEQIYSIWLQQALKYGSSKVKLIKENYKNASEFYSMGEYEWRLSGYFTNREISSLKSTSLEKCKIIADRCYTLKYRIMTIFDDDYPYLLSEISNPPCVMYIKGNTYCLETPLSIAVVGTRNATQFGIEMAHEVSRNLASSRALIVSGGAMGIDSSAHRGALSAGGSTVAVLGCGIDYPYLMGQYRMREKIAECGALVSEYPPGTKPYPSYFPIRNRIISGLSLGTVVIEAGERSGSIITANLANNQNRDVFVVPIDERNPHSKGSNALIADGAQVITCAKDILDEYSRRIGINTKARTLKSKPDNFKNYEVTSLNTLNQMEINKVKYEHANEVIDNLSDRMKSIYKVVKKGKIHIDDISYQTGIPIGELLALMTELELLDIINACSGGMYEVNHNIL